MGFHVASSPSRLLISNCAQFGSELMALGPYVRNCARKSRATHARFQP